MFSTDALLDFAEQLAAPQDLLLRALASVLLILALVLLRWIAVRVTDRRVQDQALRYRLAKISTYVALVVGVLGLGRVWITGIDTLITILGLVAAGLVVANTDVIRNLAGGLYIAVRHPLRVGDRVEIDGRAGDVVGVGSLGFNLLEIQGWVDADQSTGRVLHVPNGLLLTHPLANFGAGFSWIWHEVVGPLTFDSDVARARRILADTLERHAPSLEADDPGRERDLLISYTRLAPATYVSADERGVRLAGRLRVDSRERRRVDSAIWADLLERLASEPAITLTYAAVRTELAGGVHLDGNGTAGAATPGQEGARGPGGQRSEGGGGGVG